MDSLPPGWCIILFRKMVFYHVKQVLPLSHLKLHVIFADGLEGDVLIDPSYLFGLFEPLKDESFFNRVHCQDGFVTWPGELDLAPDAMYDAIKRNGVKILKAPQSVLA